MPPANCCKFVHLSAFVITTTFSHYQKLILTATANLILGKQEVKSILVRSFPEGSAMVGAAHQGMFQLQFHALNSLEGFLLVLGQLQKLNWNKNLVDSVGLSLTESKTSMNLGSSNFLSPICAILVLGAPHL